MPFEGLEKFISFHPCMRSLTQEPMDYKAESLLVALPNVELSGGTRKEAEPMCSAIWLSDAFLDMYLVGLLQNLLYCHFAGIYVKPICESEWLSFSDGTFNLALQHVALSLL